MRRIFSGILIGVGILMILGAAGLLLHNRQESERVASFSAWVIPMLDQYAEAAAETATAPPLVTDPAAPPREMTVVELDGSPYLGVLNIPAIDYTTPVLAESTDELLRLGACRFAGTTYAGNLVVCAHNYERLYSRVTQLSPGDLVWFTDMDGLTWSYEVADLETLGPNMVAEMTESGYDFTFFTCTYDGRSRLTLRCVLN